MKVTDWRRKLAASLVAGGLMAPCALYGANLNTNLVPDPSFENVSSVTCCYTATELNSWRDGTQHGFAYTYGQGYDNRGPLLGGSPPPSSGTYYFSPNADSGGPDVTTPGQVSQNLDVSAGATATQIGGGEAAVTFSAYFSSYADNGDYGHLHVRFLNAGGTSLGTADIDGHDDVTQWKQRRGAAFIPVGTTKIQASVYGTPKSGGPDGYMDLIDVQVTQAQNELMYLEVNTLNGQTKIKNQSGKTFHIDEYTIRSAAGGQTGDFNNNGVVDAADYVLWRDGGTLQNDPTPGVQAADYAVWRANFGKTGGSLNAAAWTSLQDQNLAGFPSGNGTGNGWEEDGGSRGVVLGESYLAGNSTVANATTLNLGAAFNVGSSQNLEFYYSLVPDDGLGGFSGPGTLTRGFVRYVTSGTGSSASIPEPTSVVFVGIGIAALAVGGRTTTRSRKR
jgi:hypothetical protein